MIETFTSPSFAISLGYILITAGVMRLSRLILTKFSGSSYTTSLGLEFCATFELIATVFELGIGNICHLTVPISSNFEPVNFFFSPPTPRFCPLRHFTHDNVQLLGSHLGVCLTRTTPPNY